MKFLADILPGKKTICGAIAFACFAVYQFYTGDTAGAVQSLIAAWTALGLRAAIANPTGAK